MVVRHVAAWVRSAACVGWGLAVVAIPLLVLVGCGKPELDEPARAYRSPTEVLAAANAAMDRGDYVAWVDCFTADCQAQQVETIIAVYATEPSDGLLGATTAPAAGPRLDDARQVEEFGRFLDKRGVTDHARRADESIAVFARRIGGAIPDKRGFLIAFLQWYRPKGAVEMRGKLTNVRTTGDMAEARLEIGSQMGAEPLTQIINFRYIAGSWRLDSTIAY